MLDEYFAHLQAKSEGQLNNAGSTNLTEICNEIVKIQKMQEQEVCKFGNYRCLHCEDGFNDLGKCWKGAFARSFTGAFSKAFEILEEAIEDSTSNQASSSIRAF
jgi:hypothetical protein